MLITEKQNRETIVISNEIISILDLIYLPNQNNFSCKIKMIKALRLIAAISLNRTFTLKESKIFIEENWHFF